MASRKFSSVPMLSLLACSACAHGRVSMGMEPSNVVIVTGTGEAAGPPDIAVITLGVEQRSQDPKQATAAVNQTMQNVIAALQSSGVDRRDLQTSQLNVNLEESPPVILPPPAPPVAPAEPPQAVEKPVAHAKATAVRSTAAAQPEAIAPSPPMLPSTPAHSTTYRAALFVTAKIRNLQRIGDTLASGFAAGANAAFGLNLTWESPNAWFDKARVAAIADAKHRALEMSRIDNLELDRIVSVSEQNCGTSTTGPQWVPYGIAPAAMMSPVPSVPFERGELTAHCALRVAYSIKY